MGTHLQHRDVGDHRISAASCMLVPNVHGHGLSGWVKITCQLSVLCCARARLRSVEVGDAVVDVRVVAWLLRPDACTSDSSEQDGQVFAQTL